MKTVKISVKQLKNLIKEQMEEDYHKWGYPPEGREIYDGPSSWASVSRSNAIEALKNAKISMEKYLSREKEVVREAGLGKVWNNDELRFNLQFIDRMLIELKQRGRF